MVKASVKANDIVAVVLKGVPLIGRLLSLKGSKAVISFGGQRRDQDLPVRELVAVGHVSDQPLPTPDEVLGVDARSQNCCGSLVDFGCRC